MIVRHWRGPSRADSASAYLDHLRMETLRRLRALDGHRGANVLRREIRDEVEFVVLTYFDQQALQYNVAIGPELADLEEPNER